MPRFEIGDCPKGSKTHGSTTVEGVGGRWRGDGKRGGRGVSGEGRMDWKEGKEREKETAIIVGKDGGWMLSFGDACIIVYVT